MLNLILDNPKRNRFEQIHQWQNNIFLITSRYSRILICFIVTHGYIWWYRCRGFEKWDWQHICRKWPVSFVEDEYKFKVVMCTSDCASVNFGKKTGLMKRMADERAWLVKIHCANHRVELAVKEAIINFKFTAVDDAYMIIFGLLKNSRKIKGIIQEACKSKNVQHFTLSKIIQLSFYWFLSF